MKANYHIYEGSPLYSFVNVDTLYTVHYFENFRDYAFEAERHDFWELAYLDSGELSAEIETSGNYITLEHGQFILIPPNIDHNFISGKENYSLFVISFASKSKSLEILKTKLIYSASHNQRYIIGRILYEARKNFKSPLSTLSFSRIELKEEGEKYTFCIIKKLVELLLLELLCNYTQASFHIVFKKDSGIYSVDTSKIIHYLQNNLYRKIKLLETAALINKSVSQTQKNFTKEVGKSIMRYFAEIRIEEAKFLLRSTDFTLAEIADKLNYNSVFHLSSGFKKIAGMPPSQYIKSLQGMIDSSQ